MKFQRRNTMKKSQLKEIIREIINEELALESNASAEAKRQGLEYFGFGRYGKNNKVTHKSVGGKLQAVKPQAAASGAGNQIPPSNKTKTKKPAPTTPTAPTSITAKLDSVHDKFEASGLARSAEGMRIPMADFTKQAGISRQEAELYTKHQKSDPLFQYIPSTGEVVVAPEAYRFLDAGRSTDNDNSAKAQQIVSKVGDKFEASGLWQYPGQTMSMNDFTKRTGISRAAAKVYVNNNEQDLDFHYNEDTDEIEVSHRPNPEYGFSAYS